MGFKFANNLTILSATEWRHFTATATTQSEMENAAWTYFKFAEEIVAFVQDPSKVSVRALDARYRFYISTHKCL